MHSSQPQTILLNYNCVYMQEKYSFRTQTKTTYTSAYSIKSIQSQYINENVLGPITMHPLDKLVIILDKKTKNKKRYSFQILKQFLLFSDQSFNSSVSNISAYYVVLTGEEKLHSLFKILETQMMEAKIWAFLNLRDWKKTRRIVQAVPICNSIVQKKQMSYKFEGLYAIKQKASQFKQVLTHQNLVNITIVSQSPKKSFKNEGVNKSDFRTSRQTQIDSYSSQKSIRHRYQINEYSAPSYCYGCSLAVCCCCTPCNYKNNGYNLQQRMQYLRMLQQMAEQYNVK